MLFGAAVSVDVGGSSGAIVWAVDEDIVYLVEDGRVETEEGRVSIKP